MNLIVCLSFISLVDSQQRFIDFSKGLLCFKPTSCKTKLSKKLFPFNPQRDVHFTLVDKNLRDHEIKMNNQRSLSASGFDVNKPTKLLIHGFVQNEFINFLFDSAPKVYKRYHDVNVIKGEKNRLSL